MSPGEYVFKIPGSTANLQLMREFVGRVARRCGFGDSDVDDIALAVDEACANVLEHGAARRARQIDVRVRDERGGRFSVTVLNRGTRIPSERFDAPDARRRIRAREPGGLGLFLIRALMDEVQLESRSARTQSLTMVKYRPPTAPGPR